MGVRRVKYTVYGIALALALAAPVAAQVPVDPAPDVLSYATAAVNPALSVIDALRSSDRGCRLARLALSEGIGNGLTLAIKHFVVSPRPCLGCTPDGMPSGHTMNSVLGTGTDHWQLGVAFAIATGSLRQAAHRHTLPQVLVGAGIGVLSESLGHLLRCQE
jgi:membrane-associated phospholipid phosphatase